jgi:hypothetical protein
MHKVERFIDETTPIVDTFKLKIGLYRILAIGQLIISKVLAILSNGIHKI